MPDTGLEPPPAPARDLCGVREAARRLTQRGHKINASTISRQIGGAVTNYGTDKKPLLDVDEILRTRTSRVDPAMRRDMPSDDLPLERGSINSERLRKIKTDADLGEIELAQKRGELVAKSDVGDAGFGLGVTLRDMMASRRPEFAQRLVGRTDVREIALAIEGDDDRLCRELVEYVKRELNRLSSDT